MAAGTASETPAETAHDPSAGTGPSESLPLADLLARRTRDGTRIAYPVTADWLQGRTAFGGLVAVLAASAMRDVLGPERALRALQVNFVGSVLPPQAEVEVTVLRAGRSVTQAQAVVRSAGETACLASAVYGAGRDSVLPVRSVQMPATRPVDALQDTPFFPQLMPPFLRQVKTRWAEGSPPFTGVETQLNRIWMQLDGPQVAPELAAILFADTMPSPLMSAARGKVYAASLAWSIELLPASAAPVPDGWWRADTELTGHADGYANQLSTVWTPAGEPAVFSHQVVAVYG